MKINYELTESDLVEYYLFHALYSPAVRKFTIAKRILITIFVFIALLAYNYRDYDAAVYNSTQGIYISGVIGATLIYFFWPYMADFQVIQAVKRLLKDQNNRALYLGYREITLDLDGLSYKTSFVESKYKWSIFTKVLQTQIYVFAYIGVENAIVIPKRVFNIDDQQGKFLDYLYSHIGG